MTTTARPSLNRKHTRASDTNREEALDAGVQLTIDGIEYVARVGDVTSEIARELRAATGMGFLKLIDLVTEDPDIDIIAALVWIARRIKGERIAYVDVSVTYAQMLSDDFDVDVAGAEEVDENPEA